MFQIFLVVGLLTGILCGPLPNFATEFPQNERFAAIKPLSESTTHIPQEINSVGSSVEPESKEKLEAQETFYPMGGIWWGVRPWGGWGGWGGYRPWHAHHWGGWGGYRPWHRPQWGGHWGGFWNGAKWGRQSF